MGKKILDSKILYIFLSIFIAIVLWFYVTALDGTPESENIRNIPVTFSGVEQLEQRGLMIVGDMPTASISVRATPMVLAKLDNKSVRLIVNVSQIQEASEYTLAYSVVLPDGVGENQVEIVSGGSGNNVTFTVARYSQREVEIRGEFVGSAAEGYLPGDNSDFRFTPEVLTVSGQAELVNQVSYVRVQVDGENLTESVSGEYPFELIGASGDVLVGLDVTCSAESIYTTFPILATAEIPLEVKFLSGGGVSAENVKFEMSTSSITVAGRKDVVDAIQEAGSIVLGTVNLAEVYDDQVITYSIPLADELTNISGVTEVRITIDLDDDLITKTFEVGPTQIKYINPPEGWRVRIITEVVAVEVRGSAALMENISEESLRIVVDLANVTQAAGQYSLNATVYLDSPATADEIGVLTGDHRVVVLLS